jgi:hypothetical protein
MKQDEYLTQLKTLARIRPLNNKNATEGFEVFQIKYEKKPCEDCGKMVVDRRIWNRVLWTPDRHWRKTCSSCNLNQHPVTKEYTVSNSNVLLVYKDYLARLSNAK